MGFSAAVRTCFSKYVTISGRARRPEYWWFFLFIVLGSIIATVADRVVFGFGLQGISFQVQCPNGGSINTVTITPSGIKVGNSVITREADGLVTGAEIADLNADGSPEVYVIHPIRWKRLLWRPDRL